MTRTERARAFYFLAFVGLFVLWGRLNYLTQFGGF